MQFSLIISLSSPDWWAGENVITIEDILFNDSQKPIAEIQSDRRHSWTSSTSSSKQQINFSNQTLPLQFPVMFDSMSILIFSAWFSHPVTCLYPDRWTWYFTNLQSPTRLRWPDRLMRLLLSTSQIQSEDHWQSPVFIYHVAQDGRAINWERETVAYRRLTCMLTPQPLRSHCHWRLSLTSPPWPLILHSDSFTFLSGRTQINGSHSLEWPDKKWEIHVIIVTAWLLELIQSLWFI